MQAQGPDGKTQQLLGLADMRQISEKAVFFAPAAQVLLPLMDGTRGLDDIVTQVGRGLTREALETIVAQLDEAFLLEGPNFESLHAKVKKEFDTLDVLPPASSWAFAESIVGQALKRQPTDDEVSEQGPKRIAEVFDLWMSKALEDASNPSVDAMPKAIVVPHLDYPRGWINYGSAYGRLRVCERPDRVIILGTNHFGLSTGVCGCDKGYQTPLGVCDLDRDVADGLRATLGEALFEHRFDHEHEHSVELQVPWIQHIFGKDDAGRFPKVFGALVHDPTVNNGESYDGAGVGLQPFVEALRQTLARLPGRTLVISSADLSHAGPAFGDEQPLAGEDEAPTSARNKVLLHDQEMVQLILQNKPAELVASMAWQQNPTRWCSIGNIVATMLVTQPTSIELFNFAASLDQQGTTMVSSISAMMN
ncbi:MAG: AmmeMemoRadiSam system protein B [Phycisphaerales bacterium]